MKAHQPWSPGSFRAARILKSLAAGGASIVVLGLSADGALGWTVQDTRERVVRDVPYSGDFLLDIHAPEGAGPHPVVVTFHGASGVKSAMTSLAVELAQHGFLVFNAQWLSPTRPLDAAATVRSFEAAACAVRFAAESAKERDGEGPPLTVIGLSAGGLAGAVVAFGGDEFEGACEASEGWPPVGLFIGLEGPYVGATERGGLAAAAREQPDLTRRLDPRSYLDRAAGISVVLFLGDQYAPPVRPAEIFTEALQAADVDVELRRVEGPHLASTFIDGVLQVLAEVYRR